MVYQERDANPEFALAWDEAKDEAVELLEAVCRKRAINGSDILMMFLLKAARPETYRDRQDVNLKGTINQEIIVDLVNPKDSND